MRLSELKNSERGTIIKVKGRGAFRKRIMEMGFVRGKEVLVIKNAPLKDPIEYTILGYEVSLRRSEADLIEVMTAEEAKLADDAIYNGVISNDILKISAKEKSHVISVALVGNPNCGKTTLFNNVSNSHEHVGNYGGVTVGAKVAKFRQGDYTFMVADLPGTYSLSAYSPEELYVRNYIFDSTPDIVINVVDASNLERNLYLTSQLIDMDIKVVAALNMYDELQARGDKFDYVLLAGMIGIPFVPTVGSKGKGVKELFDKVIEVYEDRDPVMRHIHINYGKLIEDSVKQLQQNIKKRENLFVTDKISSRFLALKLLERDKDAHNILISCSNYEQIKIAAENEIKKITLDYHEEPETAITDAKYGFISGALKETYREGVHTKRKATDIIDTFLTHRLIGFPIFIFLMWLMFQATFSLGSYPMDWIDHGVGLISSALQSRLPAGWIKDLTINGIIGGVGGVIVFLPNILILFFFISLMEDTGYMARAAFIMDKLMHKMGLHGKSFIPLIMGFGCNVPAIMATRTIENRNDRLVTMLINPLMSCSARLPVYVLLIGAFFPQYQGLVLFSLYIIGIVLAIIAAIVMKKIVFRSAEAPFVMELPPYRVPTLKSALMNMWYKAMHYLKKMSGVILFASIIIWALGYFPVNVNYTKDYDALIKKTEAGYAQKIKSLSPDSVFFGTYLTDKMNLEVKRMQLQKESEHQEKSFIGTMGHFIEPVIKPMGFDWKMGVSLITGVAAKEIVVSTMGVLYQAGDHQNEVFHLASNENGKPATGKEAGNKSLVENLRNQARPDGSKVFSPLVAYTFMIFILLYFPCIATITAIRRESGSWKWAVFTLTYTTALAWVVSVVVYQVGSLFILF